MTVQPVLIADQWRPSRQSGVFEAENPAECKPLADTYPVSSWADVDAALDSAAVAAPLLRRADGALVGDFLERYASHIEAAREALVAMAHAETALPVAAVGCGQPSTPGKAFVPAMRRWEPCGCLVRIIFRSRSTASWAETSPRRSPPVIP